MRTSAGANRGTSLAIVRAMSRTVLVFVAGAVVLTAAAAPASAQVCHEVSPGVAQIDVTSNPTTIKMVGAIPKANSVSCGFAATFITVMGRSANDTITLNYVPPAIGVSLFLGGGSDSLVVDGNAANDRIVVAPTGVDRDGDGGLDLYWDTAPAKLTIDGKAGDDLIDCVSSPVKTTITGGDGNDTLYGSAFNDAIDGGTGGDTIYGNAGNDSITGGYGDDSLVGGDGNDTFVATKIAPGGTDGHDLLFGGAGTDIASYTKRATPVIAGVGGEDDISDDVETIKGGSNADRLDFATVTAPALPHNLYGGAGNDLLRGGSANDKLFGEAGNDILDGRTGADTMDGGDGNDMFLPSADGAMDKLVCGTGRDWYTKGSEDTVNACEHALAPPTLAAGFTHACAILFGGRVKCWGRNPSGNLGVGDTDNRGDGPGEMGNTLASVDLGTTASGAAHVAVSIAAGLDHTCALLEDGSVKCWGAGARLGQGDFANRGDDPGELGNALPAVDLGTNRRAVALTAGNYTSCALLDNAQIKCWGLGLFGALGRGNSENIGDEPGEMGDALPPIDLGTGRSAIAVASTGYHTCAILDDASVKCWGQGADGELGNGSTGDVGDQPGEMGDQLPTVSLGTSRVPVALVSGGSAYHTCAVLDDGSLKCWGANIFGELGYGDTNNRGDAPGEMGDALPTVPLGAGRTAIAVSAGNYETCAVLDDRSLKCWGRADWGGLGQEDSLIRGDLPGELGDALPPIKLGTGRTATSVTVGNRYFACAALDNKLLRCWGMNQDGSLGLGNTSSYGYLPGQMGDALPYVDLGGPVAFAPDADGLADPEDPGYSIDGTLEADTTDADGADAFADDDDDSDDDSDDDDATAAGCSAGRGAGGSPLVVLGIALAIAGACRRRRH